MALAAAGAALILGCIAFFEWPNMQRSMEPMATGVVPARQTPREVDSGNESSNQATTTPALVPATGASGRQQLDNSHQAAGKPAAPSLIVAAPVRAADAGAFADPNEKEAQATLSTFLNEYCASRAAKIGRAVKATSIKWWPFGAGVLVELDEGGAYRQGSAQFQAKNGWTWLIRPESEPKAG